MGQDFILRRLFKPALRVCKFSRGSRLCTRSSQLAGVVAAAVANQFVLPKVLAEMLDADLSAADAASKAQEEAESLQQDLGG